MTRPMSARRPMDLLLTLDRGANAPEGLTRQIYTQLRAAILARTAASRRPAAAEP